MTIKWKNGVPLFFIDLLSTITGQGDQVRALFERLKKSMDFLIDASIDRVTKEDAKT